MTRYLSIAALFLVGPPSPPPRPRSPASGREKREADPPSPWTSRSRARSLTGTFTRSEQSAPISEGKVAKNTFTFKSTINDQTVAFSGELAGDDIKIWMDQQGPERAIVLKRVKK